jgi:peroxiredoxin Q/BCP
MEGKGFRDEFQELDKQGIAVVGMSADPPKKQKKFHDKHEFPYPLLCDEEHSVLSAYGAWGPKKLAGHKYEGITRISYLIDETGKIAKVYPKVKAATHAREVLEDWATLAR